MGPRLVAALKDEEGKAISRPEAAAAMWERKFVEAFPGMGELRDVTMQLDEGQDESATAPFRSDVKSVVPEEEWLSLLSGALATTKQGKAVGPDALPAEFRRAGGISLLPHLSRLAARAMTAGVPKSWRGGRMAPVPKKAMLPFTLQNSRGAMCANVAGKVVAKAVRSQLVGPLALEAGGRQHGAVPRGSTEFPSHACRLFLKEAARTRRPAAVFFTDLASAFYSALPGSHTSREFVWRS